MYGINSLFTINPGVSLTFTAVLLTDAIKASAALKHSSEVSKEPINSTNSITGTGLKK